MGKKKKDPKTFITKNSENYLANSLRTLSLNADKFDKFFSTKAYVKPDPNAKKHKYISAIWKGFNNEVNKDKEAFLSEYQSSGKKLNEYVKDKILESLKIKPGAKNEPEEFKQLAWGFTSLFNIAHIIDDKNTFSNYRDAATNDIDFEQIIKDSHTTVKEPDELKILDANEEGILYSLSKLQDDQEIRDLFHVSNVGETGIYDSTSLLLAQKNEFYQDVYSDFSENMEIEDAKSGFLSANEFTKLIQEIGKEYHPEKSLNDITPGAAQEASILMEAFGSVNLNETLEDLKFLKSKNDDFLEDFKKAGSLTVNEDKDLKEERKDREEKKKEN
jgi:hypothetical protein